MLGFDERLAHPPRRVLVAGVSGCGKSTLARRISAAIDRPYVELDALFHGPRWTPRAQFLDDVRALAATDSWVTEWLYPAARPLLAARADLLVWLDPPFLPVTLPRLVRRTLRRRLRRETLWNGNVEPPLRTVVTDPEHILRWSIATRNAYRGWVPALASTRPELTVVRLRSTRQVEHWLDTALPRLP
ncbi:AAA family ATPase [Nakamurella deserti]|uniref:AAA family ATPase n=1 Tax=Nakamurella deserti TaxID=2164074 RepID=UPI00197BE27B|nr:AAA family ATPase [Nakamurella deserti]